MGEKCGTTGNLRENKMRDIVVMTVDMHRITVDLVFLGHHVSLSVPDN